MSIISFESIIIYKHSTYFFGKTCNDSTYHELKTKIENIFIFSLTFDLPYMSVIFAFILENKVIALDIIQRFSFQAILNATVSVDTFFLLR